MENPIKMDDLGVPLFSETSKWSVFSVIQVPGYAPVPGSFTFAAKKVGHTVDGNQKSGINSPVEGGW